MVNAAHHLGLDPHAIGKGGALGMPRVKNLEGEVAEQELVLDDKHVAHAAAAKEAHGPIGFSGEKR